MLSSIAVCAHCPKARFPRSVQGNTFVALIRSFRKEKDTQSLTLIQRAGSGDMQDFKIQNIVGSCDVKFPIRLEGLALSSGTFANVSS